MPRVAELPTCQKILHACVPLISATVLDDDVISVDPRLEDEDCIGVTLRVEGDGSRQCDRRTGVVDTRNQCPTGQVGSRRLCGSLTGKSVVGSQHVGFRSLRYRVATMIGAGNRQVRYTGDGWRRIRADIAAEGCRVRCW